MINSLREREGGKEGGEARHVPSSSSRSWSRARYTISSENWEKRAMTQAREMGVGGKD